VHPEKGTLIPHIASTAPFQAGGLIIWKDDQTMVRLERTGFVQREEKIEPGTIVRDR